MGTTWVRKFGPHGNPDGNDVGTERRRFTLTITIFALKPVEAGPQVVEVCRRLGVSVATFYQ